MTTTAVGIDLATHQTWVHDLGRKLAHQVWPIMAEIFYGFETQGYKISDVRTINIGHQRFVVFGYKG